MPTDPRTRAALDASAELAAKSRQQVEETPATLKAGRAILERADAALGEKARLPRYMIVSFKRCGPSRITVRGTLDTAIARAQVLLASNGVEEVQVIDEANAVVFAKNSPASPTG